jgi:outer membrane lipoprotein-sorting protein
MTEFYSNEKSATEYGNAGDFMVRVLNSVGAAVAGLALLCNTGSMSAQAASPQLSALLAKMDVASKGFKSAQADFKWDYYEKIVHDTTTQTGTIYFQREGGSTEMGAVITDPAAKGKVVKGIHFKGAELQMFDPGVNQITVLNEASNQAAIESFLTLGFGAGGSDLAKVWNITDQGPETIDGVATEKLDLVNKDAEARKSVLHVTIWIDASRAVALKQVAYQSGGNYRTATYKNIKLNAAIDKSKFAFKTDKKTQTIKH